MAEFAHLHLHTDSSLLDGVGRVGDYARMAKEAGIHHLAITDHGVMFGAIRWFNELTKAGLHPIIGMEAYLAPESVKSRERDSYHLLLLAENDVGYRNLMELATFASLNGFYYRPRIDMEQLSRHREGLIITSACISGPVARPIVMGDGARARQNAGLLAEIAGPGRFFIELQDHGIAEQKAANRGLIEIASSLNLPLVVTNDVHYCKQADARVQEIMLCVQTGKTLNDRGRMKMESDQLYLKTADEMATLFGEIPEALSNTIAIAEMCNVDLSLKQYYLPEFDVPEEFTTDSYLEHLCLEGVKQRYGHADGEVGERLAYELNVIKSMGFSGYFLIVWDFVRFAKERGILVGPGRGSAAGSIVTYALGVTALDPLEHSLLFERFLNPDRISMPDIDIDFADDGRQEVIEYVVQKYGADRVARITTIGTLGAKQSIRDVGRVMDIPLSQVDRVAKLIPGIGPPDKKVDIEYALERVKELKDIYQTDDQMRELIDLARSVEGKARNSSTHAAGVVIARGKLVEHVPLHRPGGKTEGEVATQYDMNDLKATGLLKIDILGLTTLTILGKAVELARHKDPNLTLESIPLEDAAAYELIRNGQTHGVFQLEGGPTTSTTIDVAPERFADLTALMALIRPGPSALVPEYRERRSGRKQIEYLHPDLEAILKETYGIAIYQEQIMQLTNVLAGFSMAEGDQIRKAMGDKDFDAMARLEERFHAGCHERGISEQRSRQFWELINRFAGYGFNKAHSAAYAVIAAQTAYLKAWYPVEFMAALLGTTIGNANRIAAAILACRREGIVVLQPDVNVSSAEFSVEVLADGQEAVRYGLMAIKGVGDTAGKSIVQTRATLAGERFLTLTHFCESLDWSIVNKRTLESLARSGALDQFGGRSFVLHHLNDAIGAGQNHHRAVSRGQIGLFGPEETHTPLHDAPGIADVPQLSQPVILAYEKELLGTYFSSHPVTDFVNADLSADVIAISELAELDNGAFVKVIGLITHVRRMTTKADKQMGVLNIEDLTSSIEAVAFPQIYDKLDADVSTDRVVLVGGRVDRRGDQAQLIMTSCEILKKDDEISSETPREERTLHLTIPATSEVEKRLELLQRLDKLLGEFEGDDDLVLHLETNAGLVSRRSSTRKVDWNLDLSGELKQLLGESNVRFAQSERAAIISN